MTTVTHGQEGAPWADGSSSAGLHRRELPVFSRTWRVALRSSVLRRGPVSMRHSGPKGPHTSSWMALALPCRMRTKCLGSDG